MGRRPSSMAPLVVQFAVGKYGRRLLVDAGYVSKYENFDRDGRPHTLAFYDIFLVTRGRGWYQLDGDRYDVSPGAVFFTRPGDLRVWRTPKVEGACVFFARDFIVDAFADPRFLDRFGYFRAARGSAVLRLTPAQRRQYLERFDAMRAEIAALRNDASHALRAVVYDLLVRLNRWYVGRYGEPADAVASPKVDRFTALVERDFRRQHRVARYAADVGLTPGHLNALCRRELGSSAGRWIRRRLALEAKRLLVHGELTTAEVGYSLGFDDPSYFTRFFRREVGLSPTVFQSRQRAAED